ncbi:MAG: methionyl-tRNA formyltransferase [Acidobacteriota bacterium]
MVSPAPLRVVFFGTPEFAVPTLEALLGSSHRVVGVVTRADRPRGRGQRTTDAPVKARALSAALPVLQPERMNDLHFQAELAGLHPDVGVVAAYGKILTEPILATPRLGMINVHASLLPRYRGAAPVHRAVVNGDRETGVTIMRVVKALDAGPLIATARRSIGLEDTSDEVEHDLARIGAPLLVSVLDALAIGPVAEVSQDEALATYAHRLMREDGAVDWTRSADALHNQIRGLHPWPHAFTSHRGRRVILLRSRVVTAPDGAVDRELPIAIGERPPAGTIIEAHGDRLHVLTGAGILGITQLQGEGRRPMTAREFLAGAPFAVGDVLTNASPLEA